MFPEDDAQNFRNGARFIPGEVTVARRAEKNVVFHQKCSHPCCWYWEFETGARIYHWERYDYERTALANGNVRNAEGNFSGDIGECPDCGNIHLRGGYVKRVNV